ncbi:MAG TPA: methyltransferase domain-containing protein [Thermoleophilaceae bacterium]|nr:methyltransferase domain-containing protein [Thermoleophilaceae bacterium]
MDVEEIKRRGAAFWGEGDYARISELVRPAAGELCDACAVSAGQEVLDAAAGDGNFALACAGEGARVVASDYSPGQVERGRRRTAAEGYDVEWRLADVEDLPFADASFDCVGSVFGAMIAPRPRVVAEELFRVVRPGGTVGMTAWTPDSFFTKVISLSREYVPPAPDQPSSQEWAAAEIVRERFDGLAARFEVERRTLPWTGESPEAIVSAMAATSPDAVVLRRTLPPERFEEHQARVVELFRERGGDGPIAIDVEYAVIVARKRG